MTSTMTQKFLKECLVYDAQSGLFTWKTRPKSHFSSERAWSVFNKQFAGKAAGTLSKQSGYIRIGISGKDYQAHRLAILYVTGSFPEKEVDHINHCRNDNRISNLRPVTRLINSRNMRLRANNKSGVNGVHWNKKDQRWVAQIRENNKTIHLGMFEKKGPAVLSRKKAEKKFLYHENHGA